MLLFEDFVGSELLIVVKISVEMLLLFGKLFDDLWFSLDFRLLLVFFFVVMLILNVLIVLTFFLGLSVAFWVMLLKLFLSGFSDLRRSNGGEGGTAIGVLD